MNMDMLMENLYEQHGRLEKLAGIEDDPDYTVTIASTDTSTSDTSDNIVWPEVKDDGERIKELEGKVKELSSWVGKLEALISDFIGAKSAELRAEAKENMNAALGQDGSTKCECGTDAAGCGGMHSTWCPKFEKTY